MLVDAERLLDQFWPREVPDRFEELRIPFAAVATDYHLRSEVLFESGPLTPAVAASMAWPGLVKPVVIGERVLIDGGAVTPVPVEHAARGGLATLCVDVAGASFASEARVPDPLEAMFGASQILMTAVAQHAVSRHPPGLLVRPDVGRFAGLDFFRAGEILAVAGPVRDEVKRWLERMLED